MASIEQIADEFFVALDAAAYAEMTNVTAWVQQHEFRDDAKRVFFSGRLSAWDWAFPACVPDTGLPRTQPA